ncbi:MAG TPA: hypothetical protein VMU94_23695 [Streptosporangiaceae bacterium]|nr:hypothetical protein [Streptosporangiaceae bacterium]
MHVADCLQRSMTERNQLLIAARYAIEHPGPRGAELRQALGDSCARAHRRTRRPA